eukprot:145400-Pelagomonas_calceolata.AAC.3
MAQKCFYIHHVAGGNNSASNTASLLSLVQVVCTHPGDTSIIDKGFGRLCQSLHAVSDPWPGGAQAKANQDSQSLYKANAQH